MKTYQLNPTTTLTTVATAPAPRKPHRNSPAARSAAALTDAIAPAPVTPPPLSAPRVPAPRPPVQPLPTAVVHPDKPALKLGLDVHLEFIMAVAQRDHAAPQAPRKFIRAVATPRVPGGGGALSPVTADCGRSRDNPGRLPPKVPAAASLAAAGSYLVTGRAGWKRPAGLNRLVGGWQTHLPAVRATKSFSLIPPSAPARRV